MAGLFSEAVIKGKNIRNRIVMPPMVCFGWSDSSGMVTEDHIRHYENRAKGGVGLIIVEAACVNKDGRLSPSQIGIWSDEQIEGLRKIADVCHKNGAKVLIQIHHAGLATPDPVSSNHLCPSDFDDGKKHGRAMTVEEIHMIQDDFVRACKRAEISGFDGIEFHGAHGYLIDQFLSPVVNKRDDQYGGCRENRGRFISEIIERVKIQVPDGFIIGCRMGGNDPTIEDGIENAKILENSGVDILHVSAGISDGTLPSVPEDFPYNYIVYSGMEIKKAVNIPVIVVNDIRTPERASYLVENNMADFTAIGKGLLVDPQWANKAQHGEEIVTCLKCSKCWRFVDSRKCPRYV